MPELRSGPRRGRAQLGRRSVEPPSPAANYVKTRAAVARAAAAAAAAAEERPRTRLAAKKLEQEKPVIVISEEEEAESDVERANKKKDKERIEEGVMGDDSGGLSANKGVAQEDEGNTAPFPERVFLYFN